MSREKAPQKKKEAIYIDAWRIEEVTKGGTIQTVQVGKKTQGTSRAEAMWKSASHPLNSDTHADI